MEEEFSYCLLVAGSSQIQGPIGIAMSLILAQVQRRNELRRFTNLDFGHTIRPGMVKPNKTRTKPR